MGLNSSTYVPMISYSVSTVRKAWPILLLSDFAMPWSLWSDNEIIIIFFERPKSGYIFALIFSLQ